MRALVTGGTGFIGTHLVKKLSDEGNEIKCLVRKDSKIDFLKTLGVEFVVGDIIDKNSLKNVAENIDVVYHLASIVDHKKSIKSYKEHYDVNVSGTNNLVKACLDSDVKNFVYVSSIAVIGNRNFKKLIDENIECRPNTLYGKAKFEAEKLLLDYFNRENFPVNIVRPPVIYGDGDSKGSIFSLSRFVNNRIKKNQPYPFFSGGKSITSLCYVKNLVYGLAVVGKSGNVGEIYHIADIRPYNIREVVEIIGEVLNGNLKKISIPKSVVWFGSLFFEPFSMLGINTPLNFRKYGEMTNNIAFDVSKIRKLGYNPEDNLKKYLSETIGWYKQNNLL